MPTFLPLLQIYAREQGIKVDRLAAVPEHIASEEVDVPPGHGGDFPQQLDRSLVAGGLVALQQFREQ